MSVTFYVAKQGEKYIEPLFEYDHNTSLNVANRNAGVILETIGIDTSELCGHLSPEQCRQIADLLEEDYSKIIQTEDYQVPNGPRVIKMGLTIDQLRRYAEMLNKLADLAEEYKTYLISYC